MLKKNHTISFLGLNDILTPTYSKHEKKICMHKGENDAEKIIRNVTLKIIEKEIFF